MGKYYWQYNHSAISETVHFGIFKFSEILLRYSVCWTKGHYQRLRLKLLFIA